MKNLRALLKYLQACRTQLLFGVFCVFCTVVFSIIPPWIIKLAIDNLTKTKSLSQLLNFALLLVSVTAIAGCFRFLMRRTLIGVSRKIEYLLRNDYYAHLQKLSLEFFQEWRTGDLLSRESNDLGSVRELLGPGIMYSMHTLMLSVAAVSLMLALSPKLTLLIIPPLLLLTVLTRYFGRIVYARYQDVQEAYAEMSNRIQENLAGIRIVKAYAQEEPEIELFRTASEDYLQKNMALARIWSAFFPFLITISGLEVVFILWFGGEMVIANQLTLGALVAFMEYWVMLTWPMMALGWVMNLWQRGVVSMGRLNQIMETKPTIIDGPLTLEKFTPRIVFKNLSFQYPTRELPALRNVSFTIEAGQTVAVVGATGAGKSTLVNLMPHLWEVPPHQLFLSGVDINELSLGELRSHIGMVAQEPFLFSDTIRNNIAFGLAEVTPEQIQQALEVSQLINDLEDFPQGLQTFIGERGITLSGGQRQRLAIARAVILQPEILIFDDALSAVDLRTEEAILQRLTGVLAGRTCILISHRISSIKNADLIVVLAEGEVAEMGRHEQLLQQRGVYYHIYQRQQLLAEIEAAE